MKHAHFSIGLMLLALLSANIAAKASTNYFTEYFSGDFDLGGLSIMFEPTSSSNYYEITEAVAITELPAGIPANGAINFQYDWIPIQIFVATGKTVKLYGTSYNSFYVSPNGYITLGGPNYASYPYLSEHFDQPGISTYFTDLDPTEGGTVTVVELWSGNGVAVTFDDVPRDGNPSVRCTFQCIMFYGGAIQMAWLHTSDPSSVLVGLSKGEGYPPDYQETNLSAYYAAPPVPNDMDGDGLPDSWEAFYFGSYTNCAPFGHGDSDNYDNESEYIAGTDPTDSSSYFSLVYSRGASHITLNWNSLTGRLYSVQHTESLTSPFTNMATGITHPQNSYVSPMGSGQENGFFRTDVQMAP